MGRRTASVMPAVIKLVVLLPGLICNKRAHDANDCYLVCNGVGAGIEFRLCFSLSRLFYLTRTETGMPRLVMRLRTLQPIFASVF